MGRQAKIKCEKPGAASEFCFERQTGKRSHLFSLAKISAGAAVFAVLRGSLTVIIDGEMRTLSAGEVALAPRRSVYCMRYDEDDCEVILLTAGEEICGGLGIFEGGKCPEISPNSRQNSEKMLKILDTLLEIYDNSEKTPEISAYVASSAFYALAAIYPPIQPEKNSSRDAVCEALSYISENIEKPISLDSLADALGYTKNHLSFIFNKFTGTSLREQLNRRRLALVRRLRAEDRDSPFYRIVLRSGFDSQNTYYRALSRYGDEALPEN